MVRKRALSRGGGTTKAYSYKVILDVEGVKIGSVSMDFLPHLSVPLLGVKSFLSRFILIINYPAQVFTLQLSKH